MEFLQLLVGINKHESILWQALAQIKFVKQFSNLFVTTQLTELTQNKRFKNKHILNERLNLHL
jgi:hypothetical protein